MKYPIRLILALSWVILIILRALSVFALDVIIVAYDLNLSHCFRPWRGWGVLVVRKTYEPDPDRPGNRFVVEHVYRGPMDVLSGRVSLDRGERSYRY